MRSLRSLFLLGVLAACESQRTAVIPDSAPSAPRDPKPAEPKPAEAPPAEAKPTQAKPAETKPTETKPAESATAPAPEPRAPLATKRSADVSDELKECKMSPPPGACGTDADCTSLDIGIGRCGGCAGTLSLGVAKAQKEAYLAKSKCQRPACNKPSPSCVVHWHIADDGSRGGPNDIQVRCVKQTGNTGTCLTLRDHP